MSLTEEEKRERKKAQSKAWYEANKERVKAQVKAWREANKEHSKAQSKAWYEANKERRKAQSKALYESDKERRKAQSKAWREANKEHSKAQKKAWYEASKDRRSAYWRFKRIGVRQDQFEAQWEFQHGLCANSACRRPLVRTSSNNNAANADHCHLTNEFRGILCSGCNTAIGRLGDTAEALRCVLEYLENPPARNNPFA